jgi:hypothetical protein
MTTLVLGTPRPAERTRGLDVSPGEERPAIAQLLGSRRSPIACVRDH